MSHLVFRYGAGGFVFGCLVGGFYNYINLYHLFLLLPLAVLVIGLNKKYILAFSILFCVGFLYSYVSLTDVVVGQSVEVSGEVVDVSSPRFGVSDVRLSSHGDIFVFKSKARFHEGDYIAVKGVAQKIAGRKVYLVDTNVGLEKSGHGFIGDKIARAKLFLRSAIEEKTPEYAVLMTALIYGDDGGLDGAVKSLFQRLSITHILVVSGYNFTLILFLFIYLSQFFGKKFIYFCYPAIFLYLVFCGFEPSAVRASIFAVFFLTARLLGRLHIGTHTIVVTCALMLAFDPLLASHDLSFQFSFLAVAAIIVIFPKFKRMYDRAGFILDPFFITISVLIFTLPITLYYFGYFNPVGILANILMSLVVPVVMLFCLLIFTPFAGNGFVLLLESIMGVVFKSLYFLDNFSGVDFGLSGLSVVLIYCCLLFWLIYLSSFDTI